MKIIKSKEPVSVLDIIHWFTLLPKNNMLTYGLTHSIKCYFRIVNNVFTNLSNKSFEFLSLI